LKKEKAGGTSKTSKWSVKKKKGVEVQASVQVEAEVGGRENLEGAGTIRISATLRRFEMRTGAKRGHR